MACCNVCYVCKLQHNSFSIPLASDGWSCTKSRTIPPVFDTQITSITTLVKTSPSIFVFTFDAATAAWTVTPETFRLMLSPLSRWCHYREIQGVSRSGDRNVSVYIRSIQISTFKSNSAFSFSFQCSYVCTWRIAMNGIPSFTQKLEKPLRKLTKLS